MNYKIEEASKNQITLRDCGCGRSITNSAEEVIAELYQRGLIGGAYHKRVLYYDTDGLLNELLHNNQGKFVGFAPA